MGKTRDKLAEIAGVSHDTICKVKAIEAEAGGCGRSDRATHVKSKTRMWATSPGRAKPGCYAFMRRAESLLDGRLYAGGQIVRERRKRLLVQSVALPDRVGHGVRYLVPRFFVHVPQPQQPRVIAAEGVQALHAIADQLHGIAHGNGAPLGNVGNEQVGAVIAGMGVAYPLALSLCAAASTPSSSASRDAMRARASSAVAR